jgi:hypothetical protein
LNINKSKNLNRIIYSLREQTNIERKIGKINAHNTKSDNNSYKFLRNNFKAEELNLYNILSDKNIRSDIKKDLNILLQPNFPYPNKDRIIAGLYN